MLQRLPEAAQAASEWAAGQNFAARGQINGCVLSYVVVQNVQPICWRQHGRRRQHRACWRRARPLWLAVFITDMADLSFTTTVTWYITDMLHTGHAGHVVHDDDGCENVGRQCEIREVNLCCAEIGLYGSCLWCLTGSICFEPVGKKTVATWKWVGDGRGSYEKVENFVPLLK